MKQFIDEKDMQTNQYYVHRGTGKVFAFSADKSFSVFDIDSNGTVQKRGEALGRFPKEYQKLVLKSLIGQVEGNEQDFLKYYGPLSKSDDKMFYERQGVKYILEPLKGMKHSVFETNSFDYLVQLFEAYYPSFTARKIDWEERKREFKVKFQKVDNLDAFFNLAQEFFEPFNDGHIKLFFYSGQEGHPFDMAAIREWESGSNNIPEHHKNRCQTVTECDEYIASLNLKEATQIVDKSSLKFFLNGNIYSYDQNNENDIFESSIVWGMLNRSNEGKKIAYFCLRKNIKGILKNENQLDEAEKINLMEGLLLSILDELKYSDALVFDNRSNWGGSDLFARVISGFFASAEQPAFSVEWSNDNKSRMYFNTPVTKSGYTKPIALLTDTYVASAGEAIVLYLKDQEHIKLIGKKTQGMYSTMISKELPNGIVVTLPAQKTFDNNGVMIEGVGILPEMELDPSPDMINSVEDILLDQLSQSNKPRP